MKLPRATLALAIVASVLVVYLALGYWVAPGIVRSQILHAASERLVHPPTLERVRINPLNASVRLQRFEIARSDGHRVLGFEELYLRFDPLASLFTRSLTFDRIRLDRPSIAVEVMPDRALDAAELLRPDSTAADTAAKPPALHIRSLSITGGSASFTDPGRRPPLSLAARRVDLDLREFRTKRGANNAFSLRAATPSNETLDWEGGFTLAPFHSEGAVRIGGLEAATVTRVLGAALPFAMPSGSVDLSTRYRVDARVTPAAAELDSLEARASGWTITNPAGDTTFVALRSVAVHHGRVDATRGVATLDSIAVDGGTVSLWMTRNGHLNLEAWATPPDTAAKPMVTRIGKISTRNLNLRFEDRRVGPAAAFELNGITGSLSDLSTEKGHRARLAANAAVFDAGTCSAEGEVAIDPPAADLMLDVRGFPLTSCQPYMDHLNRIRILGGGVHAKGRMRFNDLGASGPLVRYEGGLEVRDFRCIDRKLKQDLVHWRSLTLENLRYDVLPSRLEARRVRVDGGFARVVVGPDRIPNLAVVALPDSAEPGYSTLLEPSPGPPDTLQARIDEVAIHDGSAYFSDLSLEPAFSTGIEALNGSIKGLSSFSESGGEIALDGQVDRYAPVTIRGAFNPLARGGHTDVSMAFKHIELTTFTPYSGKFMGYRIERGKLSLDLRYVVDGRQLQGENHVLMEQFTLGEHVDSPDATHLPVRFAIALLKDGDGNINLDLPVKGSLDDPKFSVGRIILKLLLGLVTKAVTSPFKALSAMFGGHEEEDLGRIEFAAGSGTLDSTQTGRLGRLAKALGEKKDLRLDIPSVYDASADSLALVAESFEARVERSITEDRSRHRNRTAGATTEERARAIERLYVADFGKAPAPAGGKGGSRKKDAASDSLAIAAEAARIADMEQRLRSQIHLDPADLTKLGHDRALAIKDRLVALGTSADQIFIVTAKEPARGPGPTVAVEMALDSR